LFVTTLDKFTTDVCGIAVPVLGYWVNGGEASTFLEWLGVINAEAIEG